jgi:TPR repeat protein
MIRTNGAVSLALAVLVFGTAGAGTVRAADGGTPRDPIPAQFNPMVELRKDAESGNVRAQYVLGCCYNGDHGFPRDPVEAARWWGTAAANGLADAQFSFGMSCFFGDGVLKDAAEAAKWWKKAADQEQPDAQYFLGLSYCTGVGVPKNTPLAIYWLKKSAGHGTKAATEILKEIGPPRG